MTPQTQGTPLGCPCGGKDGHLGWLAGQVAQSRKQKPLWIRPAEGRAALGSPRRARPPGLAGHLGGVTGALPRPACSCCPALTVDHNDFVGLTEALLAVQRPNKVLKISPRILSSRLLLTG